MAIKTYYARFVNTTPRLRAALERTHYVYIGCLRQMIERYIAMRKGRFGEECRQSANIMPSRTNTFAHGVMDQLTRTGSTSGLDDDWVVAARRLHDVRGPLFIQHEGFSQVDGVTIHTKPQGTVVPIPGRLAVPAKFWHQICDMASGYLQGNAAPMEAWRNERSQWVREKAEWEVRNSDFMRFWNGAYREFKDLCERKRVEAQTAAGRTPTVCKRQSRERGKRIDRWHLWYEWVMSHPEIMAWRNQARASDFKAIPIEVQNQFKRSRCSLCVCADA